MVPPAPTARLNDYAGLLTPADRQGLETRLTEGERVTGAQVAIAIFPSLDGESLEDFSVRLAEKWRIGQKGLDNGVILVVFVQERKLRLEVGYGLEAVIPDAETGRIIRDSVAPRFREGRYAAGLEAAVNAIFARIETRRTGAAQARPHAGRQWPVVGFGVLLAVIMLILGMEASRSRRFIDRRGVTGGRGGWSAPVIFPGGWGRGGGGSSGGGSGDSFSGGGGDFGGGGASGDW